MDEKEQNMNKNLYMMKKKHWHEMHIRRRNLTSVDGIQKKMEVEHGMNHEQW